MIPDILYTLTKKMNWFVKNKPSHKQGGIVVPHEDYSFSDSFKHDDKFRNFQTKTESSSRYRQYYQLELFHISLENGT